MERTRPCRQDSHDAGLDRRPEPDNRALRRLGGFARGAALRGLLVALAAGEVAGCALSFPISGVTTGTTPTGSIDRTAALLSPGLDGEDLRRAKAAMAVALDPQGNGARVAWQNPQTGAHGAFAASASPFADHDRVCRAFAGEVSAKAGSPRRLAGAACRDGQGAWELRDGTDGAKA